MAVPRIICGPILRRVTHKKVSVWMACSRNYHLTLKLYDGDNVKLTAGTVNDTEVSTTEALLLDLVSNATTKPEAVTVRFGQNLWIAVVTAEVVTSLLPGKIYSYNIKLTDQDEPLEKGFDLRTEGLLKDGVVEERPQKAIGYGTDKLPTFVLPAEVPKDLFIAHASCRKMHGHGMDGLAHLDKIIETAVTGTTVDPFNRPQQLFLTGDQIYADDVPGMLLDNLGVNDGETLVGDENVQIRLDNTSPIEEVLADKLSFPPFFRSHLVRTYAGFTSSDDSNHLISFEDFAGTYLNYWNIRSWTLDFYKEIKKVIEDNKNSIADAVAKRFMEHTEVDERWGLIPLIRNIPENAKKYVLNEELTEIVNDHSEDGKFAAWKKKVQRTVSEEVKEIAEFASTLPVVSRVLANVPTYMIFDDHEITDDWNLSKSWQNQVLSKPLGRDIIRNGLMAYVVFQDWGNTPDEYDAIGLFGESTSNLTPKTNLIRLISDYGYTIGTRVGIDTIRDDIIIPIENLLGMGNNPSEIKWHFDIETGPTKTFVLDTRMHRYYASLNSPPGLITKESLEDQLPDATPFGDAPFSFVVSAAPVFALQSFEELVQPAAAAVMGIKSKTGPNPGINSGRIEYDYESWGFNSEAFENLIQRLVKLKKVILLSGDVHYGFSSVLDFWEVSDTIPKARIIQLTSSSLKNEKYGFNHLYRSALAEKLLTGIGDKLEKLVWQDAVLSVTGDVTIRNRNRLRQTPAVLPIAGWQSGATVSQPPDYKYRLTVQTDASAREDDPVESDIELTNADSVKNGYLKIAERHLDNFISGVHRRMVWPSNAGLVKIDENGTNITVIHEFVFNKDNRDITKKSIAAHIKQSIPLEATGDETNPPELS